MLLTIQCLQVLIGNRLWITSNGIAINQKLEQKITEYEQMGQTVVLTSIAGESVNIVCIMYHDIYDTCTGSLQCNHF